MHIMYQNNRICFSLFKKKSIRYFSIVSSSNTSFFATTPIYYATNSPHIGHLHSSLLADAAVRCAKLKMKGKGNFLLSTGTDEHGQKVAAAAIASRLQREALTNSPSSNKDSMKTADPDSIRKESLYFCDNISDKYKSMNTSFSINADQFIRTTSWRHICVVGWLWRRLERNGSIYIGEHEGWYCQSDEAFLTDMQVVPRREYLVSSMKMKSVDETSNGEGGNEGVPLQSINEVFASNIERQDWLSEKVSLESGHTVERLKETNFMFRLTSFKEYLQKLHTTPVQNGCDINGLRKTTSFVEPQVRATEMLSIINGKVNNDVANKVDGVKGVNGLHDFSVSRRRDRAPWGLPVPSSLGVSTESRGALATEPHNIYVWLDALASYLTASAVNAQWAKDIDAKEAMASNALSQSSTLSSSSSSSFSFSSPTSPTISITKQEELMQLLPLDTDWKTLFPAWPVDLHIIGKDILKFHSLYWPSFLHGAGLPPPKRIVAHGHWTVNSTKMSKSLGNVISPQSLLSENGGNYKSDAIRYFLLREGRLNLDGDFNSQLLQQRCSKECADTFGNLATRILNKLFMPFGVATLIPGIKLGLPKELIRSIRGSDVDKKKFDSDSTTFSQEIILSSIQIELLVKAVGLRETLEEGYLNAEPGPALEKLMAFLQFANKTYSESAPWKLKPEKEDIEKWGKVKEIDRKNLILSERNLKLVGTLYTILEALRISAILLEPAMPVCSLQLINALGIERDRDRVEGVDFTSWESAEPCVTWPHNFKPVSILTSRNSASLVLFPKQLKEEHVRTGA
jgi:methionyl-tRNA synthetase